MDHHCCKTTAVWLQWSCLARHSFPWLSQEMLMCTGKKEHHLGLQPATDLCIWPAGSDLPLYLTWYPHLTCKLYPAFVFDLQDLTYLYLTCKLWPIWYFIWPAGSDLPLYLTCTLQPTFMFDQPVLLYLYIRPVISSSPSYLTCQLWPTFIFVLPALTYLYTWTCQL